MPRPEERIGTLLGGKYRIEALLALGGMGLVYAARHEHTQRAVALKLLRSELSTRPDLVRRVSIEARLAVEAAHPNVVEVLDAGADERGVPFVVLERLYGEPLEALLEAPLGVLPVAQAIVPVLNALVRLHAAGIIHRDLKPSNIFLSWTNDERLTPKLLDFGIAKALAGSSATSSGIALGTPAYMAPEQALGAGAVAPTTDVWSMGVVLARCLTGKLPFETARAERLSALRQGLRPEDLPGVPEPVARVIASALRFEPSERTKDIGALRSGLLAALRALDASAPWPGETSISYAAHECELSQRLAVNSSPLSPLPVRDDEVAGRPEHVLTKTIDIETHTSVRAPRTSARRRRRLRNGLALLALGTAAAALIVARGELYESVSSPVQSSAALLPVPGGFAAAPSATPMVVTSPGVSPPASVASPPSATGPSETAPSATAPSATPPDVTAPVADASPREEAKPVRKARSERREPSRKAAPDAPASPPSRLGANRSPIIE